MDALLETLKWLVPSGAVAATGFLAVLRWLSRSPTSELKRQLEKLKAWQEASETAEIVLGDEMPNELKRTSQIMIAPQLRTVVKLMYQIHDRSSDPGRMKKLNWGASLMLVTILVELYWPGIEPGWRIGAALPGAIGAYPLFLYLKHERSARKRTARETKELMARVLPLLAEEEAETSG